MACDENFKLRELRQKESILLRELILIWIAKSAKTKRHKLIGGLSLKAQFIVLPAAQAHINIVSYEHKRSYNVACEIKEKNRSPYVGEVGGAAGVHGRFVGGHENIS